MNFEKSEVKVAILGAGLWGKNLVRNFYNLNYLHTVCDMDEDNRKKVNADYPEVYTSNHAFRGFFRFLTFKLVCLGFVFFSCLVSSLLTGS